MPAAHENQVVRKLTDRALVCRDRGRDVLARVGPADHHDVLRIEAE